MTGNRIRDEGAKAISEILKVNTTLTTLNLYCEKKTEEKEKEKKGE